MHFDIDNGERGTPDAGAAVYRPASRSRRSPVAKRAFDVAVAVLALGFLALPMAIIALAVRLTSPGPVLFRQVREGLHARPFEMLKFRTMHATAADPAANLLTRVDDPRVTPVGRVLRATSLDELPQLFNVLVGDMSIVGPRPHPPRFHFGDLVFEDVIGRYRERHAVKPGMTGLAQVRGYRGTPEDAQAALRMIADRTASDLEYVATWSVAQDVAILLATVRCLVSNRSY